MKEKKTFRWLKLKDANFDCVEYLRVGSEELDKR